MQQERIEKTVREIFNGYVNNYVDGAFALDGNLELRPKYQREFRYSLSQSASVIYTILKCDVIGSIGKMHWADLGNGKYQCIDGQQRSISICEFLRGGFSIIYNNTPQYFENLPEDVRNKILNYKIEIQKIIGTEDEIYEWYLIINQHGEKQTPQEMRNASYCCESLEILKRQLSKPKCPGIEAWKDYISGDSIKQEFLEEILKWFSCDINTNPKDYDLNIRSEMAKIKLIGDEESYRVLNFAKDVRDWILKTFIKYRKEMKGLPWGFLYKICKDNVYDPNELEQKINALMVDDEITANKGIYLYVLLGDAKYLNQRAFDYSIKRKVYEKQGGICPHCKNHFELEQMEGHHIKPWVAGGKTIEENCEMVCKKCHSEMNG